MTSFANIGTIRTQNRYSICFSRKPFSLGVTDTLQFRSMQTLKDTEMPLVLNVLFSCTYFRQVATGNVILRCWFNFGSLKA